MTNVRSLVGLAFLAALIFTGFMTGRSQSPSARASITGIVQDQTGATTVGARVDPAYADLDLRWSRDFSVRKGKKKDEGVKATLAVDAFNVLNAVNYSSFIGNLSSPFFGRAISAQPPRRLQLSFRLKF